MFPHAADIGAEEVISSNFLWVFKRITTVCCNPVFKHLVLHRCLNRLHKPALYSVTFRL